MNHLSRRSSRFVFFLLFVVPAFELRFHNRDVKRVVEPRTFKIMVGPNCVDLARVSLTIQ